MKKRKKKKNRRPRPAHPTLFVCEGAIQYYPDGSMLEFKLQLQPHEWQDIILDTVKYAIFLDCLKTVAFPILHEQWTKEFEWYRVQLKHAVDSMKEIDPLAIIAINQENLIDAYTTQMRTNAASVVAEIKRLHNLTASDSIATISEL